MAIVAFAAFGVTSHGLRVSQEGEIHEAPAEAKRTKLTTFRAGNQMMKATQNLQKLRKEMVAVNMNIKDSINGSAMYHKSMLEAQAKADEVQALNEERHLMKGKHAIFNKTLAQERRQNGDMNKTGLWIITDEPETKEERGRRRFERGLRKANPGEYNVTKYQEAAETNKRLENLYEVRHDYYTEKMESLKEQMQAESAKIKESADFFKDNFRRMEAERAARREERAARAEKAEDTGSADSADEADDEIKAAEQALAKAQEFDAASGMEEVGKEQQ